jgi:hypothetical protein
LSLKPWNCSADAERLDPFNGLPLTATLDALFDAGLITFDEDGQMRTSPHLSATDGPLLLPTNGRLLQKPSPITARYLAYHVRHIFQA